MIENSTEATKPIKRVIDLYQYFDSLFDLNDTSADTLFASGYLRGFISLVATKYGDEEQVISTMLIEGINSKVIHAKNELSPQDYAIVNNFWLAIQNRIVF